VLFRSLIGNQNSGGANNPSVIEAANGNLYFGGGSSWSGGGTFNYTMTLTDGGSVGIGTTSPGTILAVEGSSQISHRYTDSPSTFVIGQFNATGDASINNQANAPILFATNNTERARIDSSGRLLVGTSSGTGTTSLLVVNGNTSGSLQQAEILLNNGADIAGEYGLGAIYFGGESNYQIGASISAVSESAWNTGGDTTDSPARLVFSTTADGASSPTERMRITSGGDVYIGTTTIPSSSSSGCSIDDGSFRTSFGAYTGSGNHIYFINGNGTVGTISSNGTATAYNTSSDYRLKENVVPLTGAIDRINQLQPSQFNFIADPDRTVDGFIAHEAQAIVPECITGTKDEVDADGNPIYQGIDQSKLVPLLTAALQEALQKIEDLEGRLTAAGL
jgi:hypothetical protein